MNICFTYGLQWKAALLNNSFHVQLKIATVQQKLLFNKTLSTNKSCHVCGHQLVVIIDSLLLRTHTHIISLSLSHLHLYLLLLKYTHTLSVSLSPYLLSFSFSWYTHTHIHTHFKCTYFLSNSISLSFPAHTHPLLFHATLVLTPEVSGKGDSVSFCCWSANHF